ncbi:metallophosphoesterase [Azonexus sp.]|jgi:hypothetical protein|uniref:metallophosphoesterase n=1 Tax=Azonexus sp. TaxID=1872668 RepID=UPI0028279C8E|nr:metallophosphoesterase [Azonexus sp.]MDR1994167.1 metallophosphoesterase [Azonexus sp.]
MTQAEYSNDPIEVVHRLAGCDQPPPSALTDCLPPSSLIGVILYPSLGAPLLLASKQKKCSLYIAIPYSESKFGIGAAGRMARATVAAQANPAPSHLTPAPKIPANLPAPCAYYYINHHLRLVGMEKDKPTYPDEISLDDGLYGDGEDCPLAKEAIRVWKCGIFGTGQRLHDRHGRPFATISPHIAQAYAKELDGSAVYEVELDLDKLSEKITADSRLSFAWYAPLNGKLGPWQKSECVHSADLFFARFLQRRAGQADLNPIDLANLGNCRLEEYQVKEAAAKQAGQIAHQSGRHVAVWHPVMRRAVDTPPRIGHLTDVHVNARHLALRQAVATCLPPALEETAGDLAKPHGWHKMCHALAHLNALIDKMKDEKADFLVFTGDLIDFHRNIDPAPFTAKNPNDTTPGEQWKAFNLLAHLNRNDNTYRTGIDDVLVYSLIRDCTVERGLPVFVTSGNHDAYAMPYGISPRVEAGNGWAFNLDLKEDAWPQGSGDTHRAKLEEASAWIKGRANEGIAADHNLTVYEATLAYGPTYGQIHTGNNFTPDRYDWLAVLLSPLDNFVLALGAEPDAEQPQPFALLLGLAWGEEENYKNPLEATSPAGRSRDVQGTGPLPRAKGSFTDSQLALLATTVAAKKKSGAQLVAASHFTLVNFGSEGEEKVSQALDVGSGRSLFGLYDSASGRQKRVPGFNAFNNGTCEIKLDRFFRDGILARPGVDWHISGHSHRSAVYQVEAERDDAVRARTAPVDPGLHNETRTYTPVAGSTALVVSSCGGPIGIQNVNDEMRGWTLRPPSGSLIDLGNRQVKQIVSTTDAGTGIESGRPRLCVALDYLMLMRPGEPKDRPPASSDYRFAFEAKETILPRPLGQWPKEFTLTLGRAFQVLDCITSLTLWVFEAKEADDDKKTTTPTTAKTWHRIPLSLGHFKEQANGSGVATVSFGEEDCQRIAGLAPTSGRMRPLRQAFCEVGLKAPTKSADQAWVKDMNCSDPWFFPVEIGFFYFPMRQGPRDAPFFQRRQGEFGEVPDWAFWHKHYGEKKKEGGLEYPDPKKVIRPFQDRRP